MKARWGISTGRIQMRMYTSSRSTFDMKTGASIRSSPIMCWMRRGRVQKNCMALGGGLTEDRRVDPDPRENLDEVGVAVLVWYESHQDNTESREAVNGRPQEDDGVTHGSLLQHFSVNKDRITGC